MLWWGARVGVPPPLQAGAEPWGSRVHRLQQELERQEAEVRATVERSAQLAAQAAQLEEEHQALGARARQLQADQVRAH